jgi:hypothetical protein
VGRSINVVFCVGNVVGKEGGCFVGVLAYLL